MDCIANGSHEGSVMRTEKMPLCLRHRIVLGASGRVEVSAISKRKHFLSLLASAGVS